MGTINKSALLIVIIVLFIGTVFVLTKRFSQTSVTQSIPQPTTVFSPSPKELTQTQQSYGYVGCSNTRDTIEGYHAVAGSRNLFWPFGGAAYRIGGHTIYRWANPNDPIWQDFDNMKKTYNGGQDPPVIWVQLCEVLNPSKPTYHQSNYNEVVQMLKNIKAHAGSSKLYLSPLQSYNPVSICALMGASGQEQPQDTIPWANQAVDQGLAFAGPGTKNVVNLGPLTLQNTAQDHCHPSGPAHGGAMAGSGELFLGQQLSNFFDNL